MADPIDLYLLNNKKRKKPPWEEALLARSEGLNDLYDLPLTTPSAGGAGSGAPPTGARAPGDVTIPGFDPDYMSAITGDANVITGMSDLDTLNARLIDSRKAAIRQAVIRAGLAPKNPVADLDQATLQAAQENKFSQAAEAGRGRERQSADLAAALAGRGILQSGALAGGEQRIQEGYERTSQSIIERLLDAIAGVETQVGEKQSDIVQRRAQLREEAAQRLLQDPRYRPQGQAKAVLDAATGLYVTPDGRWYQRNPDGTTTRVEAPSAGPAAPESPVPPPPTLAAPEWDLPVRVRRFGSVAA